jgi:DegV family protein with EDD domain
MTVGLVTDSAASLPPQRGSYWRIGVVPFHLTIEGVSYRDGELPSQDVEAAAGSNRVTTSAPSPGDFVKAIERHDLGGGTVVITVASNMSSSYQSAVVASRYFDDRRIRVVDSGTAAGAQGLAVLAAAQKSAEGAGLDEVAEAARDVASSVRLVAAVADLDALARSGRVPAIAALAGNRLGVRPLFEFSRGKARPLRPALGQKGSLDRILGAIDPLEGATSLFRVVVLHAGALNQARRLDQLIRTAFPESDIYTAAFSPVMTAHTGSGLVGAAWWRDYSAIGPRYQTRAS